MSNAGVCMRTTILLVFRWLFPVVLALSALSTVIAATPQEKWENAIAGWLDGDDVGPLAQLAELARGGDERAMFMLERINKRPSALSPYLQSLSRRERLALLRAEGGLSGTSWLKRVKKQQELASALLKANVIGKRWDAIKIFAKYGENGLLARTLKTEYYRSSGQELDVWWAASHSGLVPHRYKFYIWSAILAPNAGSSSEEINIKNKAIAAVNALAKSDIIQFWLTAGMIGPPALYPPRLKLNTVLWGGILHRGEAAVLWDETILEEMNALGLTDVDKLDLLNVGAALVQAWPDSQIIDRQCTQQCGEDVTGCVRTLYSVIYGVDGLLTLQSPLESLISSDRYHASKRYQLELKRLANHGKRFVQNSMKSSVNACAIGFMTLPSD
jgi:hypothetical protein